ncbi:MAG: hypothetical protein ACK41Y_16665, partial [Paracoccus hibiscisoli]|uniref:hypothetical protein n=1 Tax=Paracoccus hibiscisoli TaxID=2023261 RepID=UPI00391CEC85
AAAHAATAAASDSEEEGSERRRRNEPVRARLLRQWWRAAHDELVLRRPLFANVRAWRDGMLGDIAARFEQRAAAMPVRHPPPRLRHQQHQQQQQQQQHLPPPPVPSQQQRARTGSADTELSDRVPTPVSPRRSRASTLHDPLATPRLVSSDSQWAQQALLLSRRVAQLRGESVGELLQASLHTAHCAQLRL